jgi:hypothetical protein
MAIGLSRSPKLIAANNLGFGVLDLGVSDSIGLTFYLQQLLSFIASKKNKTHETTHFNPCNPCTVSH